MRVEAKSDRGQGRSTRDDATTLPGYAGIYKICGCSRRTLGCLLLIYSS